MKIDVGSDYSGVGAFDYAMERVKDARGLIVNKVFACDFEWSARVSYLANHGTPDDLALALTKEHKLFCGKVKKIALKEADPTEKEKQVLIEANEFAKKFSFYYPFNVYDREIPEKSLGFYMTSPPCQPFSMSGNRLGKEEVKGILFFNSYEFIKQNKPRYFSFENVRGLVSVDGGTTFNEWLNLLGGKSVNGNVVLFPYEDSLPYHLYWVIINSKEHGVPQNRERVFIVGIRDDADNDFAFPNKEPLYRNLEDILEDDVDDVYFLKPSTLKNYYEHAARNKENGNGFGFSTVDVDGVARCILTKAGSRAGDNYIVDRRKDGTEGIRKLTPMECFRCQDFPDSHVEKSYAAGLTDGALFLHAGNSITVRPLEKILMNLNL